MTAFEEMGVLPEIAQAVEEMEWHLPTDIQAESIPLILGGGDILMAAETGSGKTGAFCLPILQIVHETIQDVQEGKGRKGRSGGRPDIWQMNIFDKTENFAIGDDGLLCQSRAPQGWHGARSNRGVRKSGQYYFEVTVNNDGLCRVGWSTERALLDLGTDREGFGFGGTGKKSYGKQFDNYGESYARGDTVGCMLDLNSFTIGWSKNGRDLGIAFDIPNNMRSSTFFAAACLKCCEVKINFGDSPFKHNVPAGYIALSQASGDTMIQSTLGTSGPSLQKRANNAPFAIIIEPSRELAEQTLQQITKFKKHLTHPPVRELLLIGGVNVKEQLNAIGNGVDVVVATPGRLEDFMSSGKLQLSHVRFLVLDEFDGLLSAGYGDLITRCHQQIPKVTNDGKRLQMIVASATLRSFDVRKMADKLMYFPTWIDLKGEDSVPETVHHVVLMVDPYKDTLWKTAARHIATDEVHAKDHLNPNVETPEMMSEAVKVLKGEYVVRAIEEHRMDKAIIFCRTKVDCDNMEQYLIQKGKASGKPHEWSCACLHGDRSPQERKANLEKFKRADVRFLISTDVAARGIDVSGLPYVINVTLPDDKQNYVHRIGRVGRAERMGLAISLVSTVKEKVWYHSNCQNKGKGCYNTQLVDHGGCCIWFNEPQYLADIEEHLNITIDQIQADMKVPTNEFDGKVTYGQRRAKAGPSIYQGHVQSLAPAVAELADLERRAQTTFLAHKYLRPFATGQAS